MSTYENNCWTAPILSIRVTQMTPRKLPSNNYTIWKSHENTKILSSFNECLCEYFLEFFIFRKYQNKVIQYRKELIDVWMLLAIVANLFVSATGHILHEKNQPLFEMLSGNIFWVLIIINIFWSFPPRKCPQQKLWKFFLWEEGNHHNHHNHF